MNKIIELWIQHTDDYGDCVPAHIAKSVVLMNGGQDFANNKGVLSFRQRDGERCQVQPIFANGVGWLYPVDELTAGE